MTRADFWNHIRASKRNDPHTHAERLVARLSKLPPDQILAFDHLWGTALHEAYNWNLWGAAYLINGGCSDDGFTDFRSWLILQGRDIFQAAVKNPDTLADVVEPDDDEFECECYPAMEAWFKATGTEQNDAGYTAWHAAWKAKYPKLQPNPKLGRGWDFDNEKQLRKRLPRLASLYLNGDEDD
jgi:Protein of unknown function (DUF4240)